ncbi:MAG: helix-turn-helix domain-containing protein [Abditibacteriota bacterium]|nr:helix-turn-helix domain-containing protein [Abditibacteriota bacterium]
MTDIGQILREKREARKLTPAEVENEIKLASSSVEAIEANDFDVFPNRVYARAAVRDYANYLAVEPAPLLERLNEIFDGKKPRTPAEPEASEAEAPDAAPEEPEAPEAGGCSGMGKLILTFVVFLLLALLCYGVSRFSGGAADTDKAAPDRTAAKPAPEPATAAEPAAPAPRKYAEGVFVSVKTFAYYPTTRIRIVVDDVVKYNQGTGPAACLEYSGKRYVKVYTDNSDHIQIRVNGRLEDNMGAPGRPVTKFYQVNTPETRPAE